VRIANMSPIPTTNLNPLSPLQNNWDKITPWVNGYNKILGGLGTIFGFASAIALIASHKFHPPKWPFKGSHWHPKPDILGSDDWRQQEIDEEIILEDELAEVAAGLRKRDIINLDWTDSL